MSNLEGVPHFLRVVILFLKVCLLKSTSQWGTNRKSQSSLQGQTIHNVLSYIPTIWHSIHLTWSTSLINKYLLN